MKTTKKQLSEFVVVNHRLLVKRKYTAGVVAVLKGENVGEVYQFDITIKEPTKGELKMYTKSL